MIHKLLFNFITGQYYTFSILGGIIDKIFGDGGETTTEEAARDLDETGTRTGDKETAETFETEETSTTRSLSDETEAALEELLLANQQAILAGDTNADQLGEIATLLFERAEGAQDEINAKNDAIISQRQFQINLEIDRIETELARAAGGSRENSFVAGAVAQGRAQGGVDLAALEAGLQLQARTTQTDELVHAGNLTATAGAAEATSTNEIVAIANVLKGAVESGDVSRTGTGLTQERFNEALTRIINEITTGTRNVDDEVGLFDLFEVAAGSGGIFP